MRYIQILVLGFLFSGCQAQEVYYKEYKSLPKHAVESILQKYEATDSIYSLLIFTSGYKDENVIVENDGEVLFDDTVKSDSSMGLAKIIRVNNSLVIEIRDNSEKKYSFELEQEDVLKYKYIYLKKNVSDESNDKQLYLITYSNNLRGFR